MFIVHLDCWCVPVAGDDDDDDESPVSPTVESEYTGTSSNGGVDVTWYANDTLVHRHNA